MRSAAELTETWGSGAPSEAPLVVRLGDDVSGLAADQLGAKAVNLAALGRAGFPVPGALVVTAAAFRCFLSEANLEPEWERLEQALDPARELPDDAAFSVWRTRVRSAALPSALRRALEQALFEQGLQKTGLAVRCGTLCPPNEEGQSAGQAQLNVVGAAALERAIRRSWASLWEPRHLEGLRARGVRQLTAPPVLLQAQIAAEASGTVTTANPLTGLDDEAVVHAVPGLHDPALGDRARPDRYVTSLWSGATRSAEIGLKSVRVQVAEGGGTRDEQLAPEAARAPALTYAQLRAVVALAAKVHERAGRPVRLGFAIVDGEVVLLDGRPLDRLRFSPGLGEWRRSAEAAPRGRELKTQLAASLHALALQRSVSELAAEAKISLRQLPFHRTLFGRLYWNVGEAKRASIDAGLAALQQTALRWRTALWPLRAFLRQIRRVEAFLSQGAGDLRAFELTASALRRLAPERFAAELERLAREQVSATESLLIGTAAKLFLAEAALHRSAPTEAALPFDGLPREERGALAVRARELESVARRVSWPSRWLLRLRARRVLRLATLHLSLREHLARAHALLRRWSREAGRRLKAAGALERSGQLAHLGLEDVLSALRGGLSPEAARTRADWNRRLYRAFRNFDAPQAVDAAHPLERRGDELLIL